MKNLECTNSKCAYSKYILLCFLSISVFFALYFYVDRPVAEYFAKLNITTLSSLLEFLGQGLLWIAFFWGCAFILKSMVLRQQLVKWMFASGLWLSICYVICFILKHILGRARPSLLISDHIFGFYGPKLYEPYLSFPSGHTTTFITLALAFSILLPNYRVYLILLGLALSCTRIAFIHHYCSDIFGTTMFILLLFSILKQRIFKESL